MNAFCPWQTVSLFIVPGCLPVLDKRVQSWMGPLCAEMWQISTLVSHIQTCSIPSEHPAITCWPCVQKRIHMYRWNISSHSKCYWFHVLDCSSTRLSMGPWRRSRRFPNWGLHRFTGKPWHSHAQHWCYPGSCDWEERSSQSELQWCFVDGLL